jgi:energy-coupling factor transporter ATP-binding protein EcfA2
VDFSQNGIIFTLIIIGILVIAVWIVLKALKIALEIIVSIVDSLKKLGLTYLSSREKKLAARRRQQFCLVLRSDLDSIAKAENWNDQWFTDLEAEVEAEGGYYMNSLSRLFKRRSNGIRRIPSLVQAIKTSTERCMLLVGDPGSGKSIALRHLARILADAGTHSRANKPCVPLYINLKELPLCELEILNADYIQQFVLEHVRRGDSDTAAYVREHWQEYKEQGTWLFLFDSFDEIPAVLHAANGSQAIAAHSKALRQFMDGMGVCRGILASREYKGPEALHWQKLRILPLKSPRQEELISNTFLTEDQKHLVRQHLATVETGIFGNPLFMSLLCRYIGDNQKVPNNDHELLINHIHRLAWRDPDYVQRKYNLNAKQLLEGATLLAVLFAEQPQLSLAPKCDDIVAAFAPQQYVFPVEVTHLLSALIEVKIGRSDVKEARLGDRRFTFSHRRYQETLFIQYLAKYPDHIATRDLLLDERWREFTVTLIQSQDVTVVNRFAQEAAGIIDSLETIKIDVPHELAEGLHYFDWNNSTLLHLLTLLNEGFTRRLENVPNNLRLAISRQLLPRWQNGDLYDKLMVVRHGCLLPITEYQEIFEWAINSGTGQFLSASFNNAQYLGVLSDLMSKWLRHRFANEILIAANKIALYKLDALGNRLPSIVDPKIRTVD